MTKVEMEKPVVSKELAEAFELIQNNFTSISCNAGNYSGSIPEIENLSVSKFEDLLTRMYVLGYEIEKPKLKYIGLRALHIDCKRNYLNVDTVNGTYFVGNRENSSLIKTQFTQEEVNEFFKDEPIAMWVVEDVVSDND